MIRSQTSSHRRQLHLGRGWRLQKRAVVLAVASGGRRSRWSRLTKHWQRLSVQGLLEAHRSRATILHTELNNILRIIEQD